MTRAPTIGAPRAGLRDLAAAALRRLPPETAHDLAMLGLRHGPAGPPVAAPEGLARTVAGIRFAHPICLGAGFDKDGRAIGPLLRLGFAGVEVGSVTLRPQPGNPRPRVFRLPDERAIINRYGFNSQGVEAVAPRLAGHDGVVGASLGLNRDSSDPAGDYARVAERLGPGAHYLALNPSSPNTAGLRALLAPRSLTRIVRAVADASPRPLFVKLSPDMDGAQEAEILAALADLPVAGAIVANTTVSRDGLAPRDGLPPRDGLASPLAREAGGLSGPPLAARARAMLIRARAALPPAMPLIASGGVETGADVADRLALGASLVQVWTAFVYRGPDAPRRMLAELTAHRIARPVAHPMVDGDQPT